MDQRARISRRDVMKAGALGLSGLALPLLAGSPAHAAIAPFTDIIRANLPAETVLDGPPTVSNGVVTISGFNGSGRALLLAGDVWAARMPTSSRWRLPPGSVPDQRGAAERPRPDALHLQPGHPELLARRRR